MFVLTSSLQPGDYRIHAPEAASHLCNMLLKATGLLVAGATPVSVESIQSLAGTIQRYGCAKIMGGELAFVSVAFEEEN